MVQDDFYPKCRQINVPGFNQRIQEGHAVINRKVEDVCVKEFEHGDPRLLITSLAESSHPAEPLFAVEFLFSNALDDVQQFLSHKAFDFAKGLPLKDGAYEWSFVRLALAENQLSDLLKQWSGWVRQLPLQLLPTLEIREFCQLIARKLQQLAYLVVNIGPLRRRGQFLVSQQL